METPLNIVRLDGIHGPPPTFTIPHTYTEHPTTPPDPTTISARLHTADVAITTRVPITAAVLAACPRLKLVAVFAIGSDHVDLAACRDRNVAVCNVPAASNEAVAEHAVALFFALRRNVVGMHALTVRGVEWVRRGSLRADFGEPPRICREEVLCILGVGELGNRVAVAGRALGMTVILAERKGVPEADVREGRTGFEEALRTATVFVVTLPLEPSTRDLLSTQEFSLMRKYAILINVARGGIVNELSLIHALRTNQIAGAATDVFTTEPAGPENPLIAAAGEDWAQGRLVLSPHLAWYARCSMEKLRCTTTGNVEGWWRGEARNLVV